MGYSATFLARKRYVASDVNSIAQTLSLTPSSFTDETAYGVSDLNSITSSLVTSGVQSGCDVVKLDDTKIKINKGTLFFSNGCRVDIDTDGVFLEYSSGEKYVYALYDNAESGVSINISDSLPESGDFVPLAKYDGATVTDLRTHAKAKVTLNASQGWNRTQTIDLSQISITVPWRTDTTGFFELDIEGDDFTYLVVYGYRSMGIYNIKTGTYISCFGKVDSDYTTSSNTVYYYNVGDVYKMLYFESLEYGKLKLKYTINLWRSSSAGGTTNTNFDAKVILA